MTSEYDVIFPWLRPIRAQLLSLDFPIVVAFSGGLDSTCLLHMVCQILPIDKCAALHVNHGLSPNANAWELHCQTICQQWNCAYEAHSVNLNLQGQGIEAAARDARYAIFENCLRAGGSLLQAHHADDQVETLLLNLLRGSGPAGMSGIPSQRELAGSHLFRPLLSVSRAQLEAYAAHFGLSFIDDESNQSEVFDRNYLRAVVTPKLKERFSHIYSAAKACSEAMLDAEYLQRTLAWQDADLSQSELAIESLLRLDDIRCRNVLRYWFEFHTGQSLSRSGLKQIVSSVLQASIDAAPCVVLGGWSVRRSRHLLAVLPSQTKTSSWSEVWDLTHPLKTPFGVLIAQPSMGGLRLPAQVEVTFRRGGEKMRPAGRGISKTLKSLFKENNVPLWKREMTPLLWHNDALLWAAHLGFDESCAGRDNEMGWQLIWQQQILSADT